MLGGFYIATINIIICSLLSYYLGPFVKGLGTKFKILDIPDLRKVHKIPVVRIGGVSIFLTFISYFLFTYFFSSFAGNYSFHDDKLFVILIGSLSFFLIGIHDDIYKSSPIFRLFLQFLIAILVSLKGIGFNSFNFYSLKLIKFS